jgi:hypothetical protein
LLYSKKINIYINIYDEHNLSFICDMAKRTVFSRDKSKSSFTSSHVFYSEIVV